MEIIKIISQHRRDFTAEIKCEHCSTIRILNDGYDDAFYHNSVIPNMNCEKCNESSISKKSEVPPRRLKPLYEEGFQI